MKFLATLHLRRLNVDAPSFINVFVSGIACSSIHNTVVPQHSVFTVLYRAKAAHLPNLLLRANAARSKIDIFNHHGVSLK